MMGIRFFISGCPAGSIASGTLTVLLIERIYCFPGTVASSALCRGIWNVYVPVTTAYFAGGVELKIINSLTTAPGALY